MVTYSNKDGIPILRKSTSDPVAAVSTQAAKAPGTSLCHASRAPEAAEEPAVVRSEKNRSTMR